MSKYSLTAAMYNIYTKEVANGLSGSLESLVSQPMGAQDSEVLVEPAAAKPRFPSHAVVLEGAYDYQNPKRSGELWEDGEEEFLLASYEAGDDAMTLCRKHQRPLGGVLARLCKLKKLVREGDKTKHWFKGHKWSYKFYRADSGALHADYPELKKQYQL